MGSLFIKNFKREPISDKIQFLNTVIYTHRNPIHHGFRKKYDEWEYSSYNEIIDGICDPIELGKLIKMFGNLESFKKNAPAQPRKFYQTQRTRNTLNP
ncbi:MAG TPA: hypothetical protein DCR40_03940 [Prolixibacteraceae bacterium]|nr:hypothetical protein [Prolixibacteraceae bacterium]